MQLNTFETLVQDLGEQQDIAVSSLTPPQRQLCIVLCGDEEGSEEVKYDIVHLSDKRILCTSTHTGDFFCESLEEVLTLIHGD